MGAISLSPLEFTHRDLEKVRATFPEAVSRMIPGLRMSFPSCTVSDALTID